MIERILGPLPEWFSRKNPLVYHRLKGTDAPDRRTRLVRAFVRMVGLLLLGFAGYFIATGGLTRSAGQNFAEVANNTLFYPMLVLQMSIAAAAFALTVGVVGNEQRRLTWDVLRATAGGAGFTLRASWAAVFYRLGGLIAVLIVLRVLLIGGLLVNLMAFQGRYIDRLVSNIVPTIPVELNGVLIAAPLGLLLLAMFLAATLLLPITTVAFEAALGLWFSSWLHQRVYSLIVQFMLLLMRGALVVLLVYSVLGFAPSSTLIGSGVGLANTNALTQWLTVFAFTAFADWGVKMTHLQFAGEMWAVIPYGLFISPALLLFVFLQAFAAHQILKRAVHNAERRG